MARNVEIKARVSDLAAVEARAAAIAGGPRRVLRQEDTFFRVAAGRLKLRDFGAGRGELIWYERADDRGPKESSYHIVPTADPAALKRALAGACGLLGVVAKERRLYLVGQTRVHIDRVEGLGDFVELEYVLGKGEPPERGREEVARLMDALGIRDRDLEARAYVDLLLDRRHDAPAPPGGAVEAVADASHLYDVERRALHAERPGFRISELQISTTQEVPWHLHTAIADTFYVIEGRLRLMLRGPDEEVRIGPGETYCVRPRRPHRVVNDGDGSATFLVLQGVGEYDYVPLAPNRGEQP